MSPLSSLIDQEIYTVPAFDLECGVTLKQVPVAYKTWGVLNATKDNVMIICHAFTGSADVEDWWGPLMGVGRAFDPHRFFIVCANVLGSPYGTASPITINPDTGTPYGPEFPPTSIRDDIRLHKLVLDSLGVSSVYVVIGGSMGGMAVLEWPLCTPPGYVKHIIPLATSARHSAWCISWGEAQRQAIYSDPDYDDGWYPFDKQPRAGLAAARMSALLTYRSRDSFEGRFGRKRQMGVHPSTSKLDASAQTEPEDSPLAAHNDGYRSPRPRPPSVSSQTSVMTTKKPAIFTAQSYLRYQGDKFTMRFDANCYIHITRKLDTHDLARGRVQEDEETEDEDRLSQFLARLPPALVISIASDGLFTPSEQALIAEHIPDSQLFVIPSKDGHDGFLLEFKEIGHAIRTWLEGRGINYGDPESQELDWSVKKESLFGEAEVDVVSW